MTVITEKSFLEILIRPQKGRPSRTCGVLDLEIFLPRTAIPAVAERLLYLLFSVELLLVSDMNSVRLTTSTLKSDPLNGKHILDHPAVKYNVTGLVSRRKNVKIHFV